MLSLKYQPLAFEWCALDELRLKIFKVGLVEQETDGTANESALNIYMHRYFNCLSVDAEVLMTV
jgi:hypothetical protein